MVSAQYLKQRFTNSRQIWYTEAPWKGKDQVWISWPWPYFQGDKGNLRWQHMQDAFRTSSAHIQLSLMELNTATLMDKGKTTLWPADLELIEYWRLLNRIVGVTPTVAIKNQRILNPSSGFIIRRNPTTFNTYISRAKAHQIYTTRGWRWSGHTYLFKICYSKALSINTAINRTLHCCISPVLACRDKMKGLLDKSISNWTYVLGPIARVSNTPRAFCAACDAFFQIYYIYVLYSPPCSRG